MEAENNDHEGCQYDDPQRRRSSKGQRAASDETGEAEQRVHEPSLRHRLLEQSRCLRRVFHLIIGDRSDYADTEVPRCEDQAAGREQKPLYTTRHETLLFHVYAGGLLILLARSPADVRERAPIRGEGLFSDAIGLAVDLHDVSDLPRRESLE